MNRRVVMWLYLSGLVGAAAGCAHAWRAPSVLPGGFLTTREQLVIHSDFPLPAHHRLVEELLARRGDLCRHLELPVSDEPIDIYLFETPDAFAQFIRRQYPGFPQRRAFFVETDTRLAIYAQWGDRVAEDLRHETAHGYLHAVLPDIPLWLDEGLAEYYETPRGSQGWNAEHVAWLRKQIAAERWRPHLARLEQLPASADLSEADYAEAWLWVHYLLQTGGAPRQTLRDYLADLRRDGHATPLSERLRAIWGDPDRVLIDHARAVTTRAPALPPAQ